MQHLKRDNPFMDEEMLKEITRRMNMAPAQPTEQQPEPTPQESLTETDALECTFLHIGRHG